MGHCSRSSRKMGTTCGELSVKKQYDRISVTSHASELCLLGFLVKGL